LLAEHLFVRPHRLFNRDKVLFRNFHSHAGHPADNLDFTGIAKRSRLFARIWMRDKSKLPVFDFAPPTRVSGSDVGEVRGSEAFELLQLLNTGHSGSLSTVHASSAKQALARFTSCVLESGVELPYRAIKTNIADSLNAVVHIERRPGCRFISEVVELHSYDPDADLFNYSSIFRQEEATP
jgi:hypothetical protein